MNRTIRMLALLAMVFVVAAVHAAMAQSGPTTKVLLDKDRNALVLNERKEPASPSVSTELKFGSDLATGLTTLLFTGNVPKESVTISKGTLLMYSQLNNAGGLVLGDWKFELPPDAKFNLNADGKVQQNDKIMHIEGKAAAQLPNPRGKEAFPFQKLALDSKWKTKEASWSGKVTLGLEGPDVGKNLNMPMKSIKVTITEPAPSGAPATPPAPGASPTMAVPDVLTTIDFEMSADAKSPLGQQMKTWVAEKDKFADGIKQFINGGKAQAESVTVTKAEATGDTTTFAVNIKARKVREAFGPMLRTWLHNQVGNIPDVKKEDINRFADAVLSLQMDKIEFAVNNTPTKGDVTLDMVLVNFDRFLPGWLHFSTVVQEALGKQGEKAAVGDRITTVLIKWWTAIRKNANDVSLAMNKAISDTKAEVFQSFTFNVNVDTTNPIVMLETTLKKDVSNPDKVREAIKKQGIVVPDQVGLLFNVKTADGKLTGQLYANAMGDIVRVVKAHFIAPAQDDPSLKTAATMLDNVKVEDSRWTATLKDGKFELNGFAKSSDLTPLFTAALQKASASLAGTPTGFRMQRAAKGGTEVLTFAIAFKQFMAGKSDGDVKSAVGSLFKGDVTVDDKAQAAQMALAPPTLQQPDLKQPQELAQVKKTGDETVMAALAGGPGGSPGAGGTGGAGGPGANTGMVVGIVVGAVALFGIIFLATRKR